MVENSPLFNLTNYVNQLSGELDKYLADLHQHDAVIYSRCTAQLPGQVKIPAASTVNVPSFAHPTTSHIPRGQIMATYSTPTSHHAVVGGQHVTSNYFVSPCATVKLEPTAVLEPHEVLRDPLPELKVEAIDFEDPELDE